MFLLLWNQATAQTINIATAADLAKIGIDANYPLDGDYVQTADINLSGYTNWTPIGTFTGTYDGQYHRIDNLTITGTDNGYKGLFEFIDNTGEIRNLHFYNVNINLEGRSVRVGAVAGYSHGKIVRVAVHNGTIRAYQQVGGIVGDLLPPGELSECYANVAVEDNGYIYFPPVPNPVESKGAYFGVLTGENRSVVTNCYAKGSVTGTSDVGGLIGYNTANSTVSNSYSSGAVSGDDWLGGLIGLNGGDIANSYWNTTTSGQSTSHGTGAIGKTDAQMRQQATFAGWDFANIWAIAPGSEPHLQWLDSAPLPVSLVDFTAQIQGNKTKLAWQTATESNNKEFVVYRSADNGHFTETAKIAGAGNSSAPKAYNYYDENPLDGNNYYKLVQVDNNGKETDLGTKILNFSLSAFGLQLFPNPTDDAVNVSFGSKKHSALTVMDFNGKVLQKVKIKPTETSLKVSLDNYPTGTYLFQLNGSEGTASGKILKK